MKIGKPCLMAAAVTALMTATPKPTSAQVPVITFNEFGVMTIGGVPGPFGVLMLEPLSGLMTLAYLLPFPFVPGDIVLLEPGPAPAPISDVLRFSTFGPFLFVFSEATLGEPPEPGVLADGPLPPALPPGFGLTIILDEMGPEVGPNGLFGYVAPPGTPGAFIGGGSPTYDFFSDLAPAAAVPEPGSLLLTCTGGVALALARRRRARTNRAAA